MDKRWIMRKKEQMIYCGIAIVAAALLIVFLGHMIFKNQIHNQRNIESKLPYGLRQESVQNPVIRVLIKTNGFQQMAHSKIELSAKHGLIVSVGDTRKEYGADEKFSITPDSPLFQNGSVCVEPKKDTDKMTVLNLQRGYGTPSYRGKFELFATAEGIVLINELLMEEYLCAVVPSEMPASYEKEALKTQAVCARSYAYCQTRTLSYPEYQAHVDDSTSFQVYGNSKEKESAIQAVNATMGEKLWYQNQVVKAYYYSTSSGKSTSIEAWGTKLTKSNQYLKGVDICDEEGTPYEKQLPWYSWSAEIPAQTLSDLIELNTETEIGTLQNVTVTKQGAGGVALQITVDGTEGKITVDTENKIRSALGGSGYKIKKQDGTIVDSMKLLPSAFFSICKDGNYYVIEGGGYGHGIGMSQNGANEMAKKGKKYQEILQTFYPGTKVK